MNNKVFYDGDHIKVIENEKYPGLKYQGYYGKVLKWHFDNWYEVTLFNVKNSLLYNSHELELVRRESSNLSSPFKGGFIK